jgi:hypothetical protein
MEATMSPEEFISGAFVAMPELSRKEGLRLIEHGWAWATVFYDGVVPPSLLTQLERLEKLCLFSTM